MYRHFYPNRSKTKFLQRNFIPTLFLKSTANFNSYYKFKDILKNPKLKSSKTSSAMYIEDVQELHKGVDKSNELIKDYIDENILSNKDRDFYTTKRVLKDANKVADLAEKKVAKETDHCFYETAAEVLQNPDEFKRTAFAGRSESADDTEDDLDLDEDEDEMEEVAYEETLKNQAETFQKATFVAMMRAGCHYGARASDSNPFMHQFLLCERDGQHIFDITKSLAALRKVMLVLQNIVTDGGAVWFVGNSEASKDFIEELAMDCDEAFLKTEVERGMLTNFNLVQKRARNIIKMDTKTTSQEQAIAKSYQHAPYRLKDTPPAIIVILNKTGNETLIHEARLMRIPIACICDSDTDPKYVSYVIPGNDKSPHSVRFFMEMLSMTIKETKRQISEREFLLLKKKKEKKQENRELTEKVRKRLNTNDGLLNIEMLNPRKYRRNKEKKTVLTREHMISQMKNIVIDE